MIKVSFSNIAVTSGKLSIMKLWFRIVRKYENDTIQIIFNKISNNEFIMHIILSMIFQETSVVCFKIAIDHDF